MNNEVNVLFAKIRALLVAAHVSDEVFDAIDAILIKWGTLMARAHSLADKLPEPLAQLFANSFLHAIVRVLKRNNLDNTDTRKIALSFTIQLWAIDDAAWEPEWVL